MDEDDKELNPDLLDEALDDAELPVEEEEETEDIDKLAAAEDEDEEEEAPW